MHQNFTPWASSGVTTNVSKVPLMASLCKQYPVYQLANCQDFESLLEVVHLCRCSSCYDTTDSTGANLAFEDGLELALQLSSASDLRFSFITDLLVCGKTGGFIFSTLCSFCNIRHEQSSLTSDCQCVATLCHSDSEGLCVREKSKERITKCLGLIFADTAD